MKRIIDHADANLPDDVMKLNAELRKNRNIAPHDTAATSEAMSFSITTGDGTEPAENRRSRNTSDYPLERWDVQAYAYSETEAGSVSLFASLFGGEVKHVKAGVIHEAKRFTLESTDSHSMEIGVAVRLSVATTSLDSKINLTLPNLAANAQLHNTDTRIGISVIGYAGPLGQYLPAPSKLDVETCIEYWNAFREIQKIVFSAEGLTYVVPTVLNYENKS